MAPVLTRLILMLVVAIMSRPADAVVLGAVTRWKQGPNSVTVCCGIPRVRIEAWDDDVIRVWLSNDGLFNYYDSYNDYLIDPGRENLSGPASFRVAELGGSIEVRTDSLLVRIGKKPFRLSFHSAADGTLLTRSPEQGALDTDYRAWFERDAAGNTEHFFGLQMHPGATTLDLRDTVCVTQDHNGHGWVAPLFLSTAGYGIFFHNEYGWENHFSFGSRICFENTGSHGQLDFFFIRGPRFPQILDRYTALTGRPVLPPKKLLGFNYLVQGTPITHEEAFPEWIARRYPIDGCITFTDKPVETEEDMAAVNATARRIHAAHGSFGFYFDLNPCPGTFRDLNPEDREYPYDQWNRFTSVLTDRLLKNGVDWFWVDETDDFGKVETLDERGPFHLYRAMTGAMTAFDGRRGFLCGRGGYAGCQRFGYPWMGDIPYDRTCILANLANGLVGVAHSTHDLSGASVSQLSETAFLQGVKTNLLNPITQCNSWVPGQKPCHRPWEWSPKAEAVFRKFLDLHYRLVPYFYTTFRQAHDTGLPDWRALVLNWQDDPNTYGSDEFMIGDWLLAAPLYSGLSRDVYLPAGKWIYYFTDQVYEGPATLKDFTVRDEEYPLFVRAGAVIPMMPPVRNLDGPSSKTRILAVYPHGESACSVYEDDGTTVAYRKGAFSRTPVICRETAERVTVEIGTSAGESTFSPEEYILEIHLADKPSSVKINGQTVPEVSGNGERTSGSTEWSLSTLYPEHSRGIVVRIPSASAGTVVELNQ